MRIVLPHRVVARNEETVIKTTFWWSLHGLVSTRYQTGDSQSNDLVDFQLSWILTSFFYPPTKGFLMVKIYLYFLLLVFLLEKDNLKIMDRKFMLGTNLNPPSGVQIRKGN